MKAADSIFILTFAHTLALAPALLGSGIAFAEPIRVIWGGFIDTQYAFDLNQPQGIDRAYTTQPARHNELNVNLAYVEAKLLGEKVRGRLALQLGTSVQSNYASEPQVGSVSGGSMSRHLQEGVVGYRLNELWWIDAGVYFSHIGVENWVSKENWALSRTLISEFSPYYQSGVKLSYEGNEGVSGQLHILNGWQNMSENNSQKALGISGTYAPKNSRFEGTYNNFMGREVEYRWRLFHNVILKWKSSDSLQFSMNYDRGWQQTGDLSSWQSWHGFAVFARYQAQAGWASTLRLEGYFDPDQVIVSTASDHGFQVWGGSLNVDQPLTEQVVWRNEIRLLSSKDAIYPSATRLVKNDSFVLSSLSINF